MMKRILAGLAIASALAGSAMAGSMQWTREGAAPLDLRGGAKDGAAGYDRVLPGVEIPGASRPDRNAGQFSVQVAQTGDAAFRINQLEEEIRQLTGRIEEMTFQMLQLQEQIRKMQEDNEFRFQELEDKRGDLGGGTPEVAASQSDGDAGLGKPQPSDAGAPAEGADVSGGTDRRPTIAEVIEQEGGLDGGTGAAGDQAGGQDRLGAPPLNLGTITFDANGNIIDTNVGKPIQLTRPDDTVSASLPGDPQELFDLGYQYVQAGEYERAAGAFEALDQQHPDYRRRPEARFWLGESYFSLGRYEDSARVFLENHKQYPDAPLAAENLLKLGVSLAGLNQRELACATYAEVGKKYPSSPKSLRDRVAVEQKSAKCKSG